MSDYQQYPNWNLPFRGGVIRSQPFGRTEFSQSPEGVKAYMGKNHEGHDTYSETTNEVRSVCDGVVIVDNDSYTGVPFPAYGNTVIIKENGTNKAFYYCHLDSNKVNAGQQVKRGDVIAIKGGSAFGMQRSFGFHLHLGMAELTEQNTRLNQNNGTYGFIDPEPYIIKANNEYNYPTNSNGDINPNQQQPMQEDIKIIVTECINQGLNFDTQSGKEKIAYILATAKHETNNFDTLEEYADGSAYEGRSDLGNNQKGDGVKYKGRGYVQITGRNNYKKYAEITGKNLVNNPRLAQEDKSLAAFILVHGMISGGFTDRKLSDYPYTYKLEDSEVKAGKTQVGEVGIDFYEARRIVNGTDQAARIAGYANAYLNDINTGSIRVIPNTPITVPSFEKSLKALQESGKFDQPPFKNNPALIGAFQSSLDLDYIGFEFVERDKARVKLETENKDLKTQIEALKNQPKPAEVKKNEEVLSQEEKSQIQGQEKPQIDYGQILKILSGLAITLSPLLAQCCNIQIDPLVNSITPFLGSVILLFTNPNPYKKIINVKRN